MKKACSLLLILAFMVSLVACGANDTPDTSTTTQASDATTTVAEFDENVTTVEDSKKTTAVAQTTTTTETQPTKPEKLNPKKDFTRGTYVTTFFGDNNQSYHEVSLYFYEEFDTVEFHTETFYTKDYCKKQAEQNGYDFDEENFYESEKDVNGTTYYNIGDWGHVPENFTVTDTTIEAAGYVFSLNADGTLAVESAPDSKCGKVGTVYTFLKQ